MRTTILPLALLAAAALPATAGATDVKRSIKGADLVLTVPTECTTGGSVLPAVLKVKLKRSARYDVRSIQWRLDGRRIKDVYSKPYDLRLATSSLEPGRTYTVEARMYTELGQRTPKVKLSAPVAICPEAA